MLSPGLFLEKCVVVVAYIIIFTGGPQETNYETKTFICGLHIIIKKKINLYISVNTTEAV